MTSSKVTLAVLDSLCPNLSSGLPITILPPAGTFISLVEFPMSGISEEVTCSTGIITQAIKLLVGFPTLQRTVYCEAYEALVIKHLEPFKTYVPSSFLTMKAVSYTHLRAHETV